LLAAVVFAVHPVHAEVVNSVFNGSEMLASLGVAGGLWWFLRARENAAFSAWLGLGAVYLLALLCRESAASLPAIAVALLWLTDRDRWTLRLRKALPVLWLLVPLLIYLALRAHALEPPPAVEPASQLAAEPAPAEPTADAAPPAGPKRWSAPRNLPDYRIAFRPERTLGAAGLWLESLRIMVWPHPLQIYYDPPDTNPWVAAFLQLLLLGLALLAYLKRRPGLLIGLVFFYLAILPSSQLFGPLAAAPGLADRILYLPSVGLTIALAAGLLWLLRRFGPRIAVAAVAVIGLALVPLTWARNAEWINDVVLAESTYQRLDDKDIVLDTLIAAHLREGSLQRAVELCDTHSEGWPPGRSLGVHCGSAYGRADRLADAEKAYLSAIHHRKTNPTVFAHINLAMLYIHLGRRAEAIAHFEQAIARDKVAFRQAYFSALMLIQMFPGDRERLLEARTHLERALALQPRHAESRAELASLDARLASLKAEPGE
jgi:tetratricopeptide (TPR) repeat protein